MNIRFGKSIRGMRVASMVGVCVCVLGSAASNGGASLPNTHRDLSNDFASRFAAPTSGDDEQPTATATAPDTKSKLNQEERFTNKTNTAEYRLRLENPADTVHLTVSAEVEHGLVRWELIQAEQRAPESEPLNAPAWTPQTFRPSRASGFCA
jgi:hypothetical protein